MTLPVLCQCPEKAVGYALVLLGSLGSVISSTSLLLIVFLKGHCVTLQDLCYAWVLGCVPKQTAKQGPHTS